MTIKVLLTMQSVLFCLPLVVSQVAYANPQLSQDKAAGVAKHFTQVLNTLAAPTGPSQTVVAEATGHIEYQDPQSDLNHSTNALAGYLAALHVPEMLENKGHPYWKVSKPGAFEIEVDNGTGKIVAYTNYMTRDALNDCPAGPSISKSRALSIAEEAMAAAGQPVDTMKLQWVAEEQGKIPPTASMHKISIAWLRTYQGIPFHREGGGVMLEAETGDVISVGIGCISPDPVSTAENVSKYQAINIANAQLEAVSLSITDIPLMTVSKEIVHPNFYWHTGDAMHTGDEELLGLQTRVVWNCHFGSPENNFQVWVDTETGDVVGGDYEGTLGRGTKIPKPKFGHQIKYKELTVKGR